MIQGQEDSIGQQIEIEADKAIIQQVFENVVYKAQQMASEAKPIYLSCQIQDPSQQQSLSAINDLFKNNDEDLDCQKLVIDIEFMIDRKKMASQMNIFSENDLVSLEFNLSICQQLCKKLGGDIDYK